MYIGQVVNFRPKFDFLCTAFHPRLLCWHCDVSLPIILLKAKLCLYSYIGVYPSCSYLLTAGKVLHENLLAHGSTTHTGKANQSPNRVGRLLYRYAMKHTTHAPLNTPHTTISSMHTFYEHMTVTSIEPMFIWLCTNSYRGEGV